MRGSTTFLYCAFTTANLLVSSGDANSGDFVSTKTAALHGVTQTHLGKTVKAYLGVPYAEPPVGHLRFSRPVRAKQKDRMILATEFKPPCMQLNGALQDLPWFQVDDGVSSEDCLYLNVWVTECKELDTNATCPLKPVLVWLHGGGFRGGSSTMDVYNGGTLAASGDIVVVTLNYRLGAFGFLSLNVSDIPGNMGLYDQHLALRWLRSNVQYFGGDPKAITLAGQDAGATSVGLHLTSPLSRRLIRRAILIGGAPNWLVDPLSTSSSYVRALMLTSALSCSDSTSVRTAPVVARCLRDAKAKTIARAESEIFKQAYYTFWPRDRDELVPMDPVTAVARGNVLPVDILVGVTAESGYSQGMAFQRTLFDAKSSSSEVSKESATRVLNDVLFLFPRSARDEVAQFYFGNSTDDRAGSVRAALAQALGDVFINCPAVFFAESYGDRPMKSFFYKFSYRPTFSRWPAWFGSTHFDDVPFLFGVPLRHPNKFSSKDGAVSRIMVEILTSFVKTGVPKPTEEIDWPQYTSTTPEYLEVDSGDVSRKQDPFIRCDFWRRYYPRSV
ncbi:acetylcholinesterase-1 [Dermacentor silvarum]|uniref:acetylcholinesterase-1 n=1 Tax=Dermacentor silvarum TaxID=543639 RepID=UPI00189C2715|nr:acetylcholinesterase-1 [Dermacentor silvarum]